MASISNLDASLVAGDYLQLLVVQLRNQDPEEPMSNAEMVSQMAQLSALSEMTKLNVSFKDLLKFERLLAGGSLVGREVEYLGGDGASVRGTVDAVVLREDATFLTVDGKEISSDRVQKVL